MAGRRDFSIPFVGLKPGLHHFEYVLDDRFFEEFGKQDFTNCNAVVKLELDKHSGFLQLKFGVGGSAEVVCDRCGNTLPMDLWDEFGLLVKMTDEPEKMNEEEGDPDVFYISRTESHIDVKSWLYEFVLLSIPMQKRCKEEEIGSSFCNKEVLARLAALNPQPADNKSVWKNLDQFRTE